MKKFIGAFFRDSDPEVIEAEHERFATELCNGHIFETLTRQTETGIQISPITINKRIHTKEGLPFDNNDYKRCRRLGDHPVFYVINQIEPESNASDSKKPYLTFEEALKVAREQFAAAQATGEWK